MSCPQADRVGRLRARLRLAALPAATVLMASLLASLPAQQPNNVVGSALQRQLQDRQRELAQKQSESERLLDLLVRASLGLDIGADGTFHLTEVERTQPRAELESRLAETLQTVAQLGTALQDARDQLDSQRAALVARGHVDPTAAPRSPAATKPAMPVPPATPMVETARPPAPSPLPSPSPPAAESTPPTSATPSPAKAEEGPPPLLLHGTNDPALLGTALFHAGKLDRAREQLEKVAERTDAPLADLFTLARTYEGLADYARADSTYLRIEEADTSHQPDGTQVLGPWASAARSARQHMAWMRENGSWRPVLPGAEGK